MPPRRRITSHVMVVLAVAAAGLVFAASAPALDIEPFVSFVDHGITPNVERVTADADEGAPELPDYFGSAESELTRNQRMLGFDAEEAAPTPDEIRNQTDWCLWSELGQTAIQIDAGDTTSSDGTTLSPIQMLFDNVTSCLRTHIPGVSYSQLASLANSLVYQKEIHLVQSQSGLDAQSASEWLQQYSLRFTPSTWANWLNFVADELPPAS